MGFNKLFYYNPSKDGYEFILPPHLLNEDTGFGAGQFPKFKEDVCSRNGTKKVLLPTAETVLVNLYRNDFKRRFA